MRGFDLLVLSIALVVVAVSALLVPDAHGVSLFGWRLPETCLFVRTFDIQCLGCGLTRSFASMADGAVAAAWNFHKVGPVLFVVVIGQIPWRVWRLIRHR